MTGEVKYATVDDIRQLVDCLKLVQNQLNGLQTQIELLQAKSLEEINTILGKRVAEAKKRVREDPNIGLEGLHKMALEVPGHKEEENPRRDAKGDLIPWTEEHDYFFGFDPENPDVPTD